MAPLKFGEIAFRIDRSRTTRTSDTDATENECRIGNLQILVFDENGEMESYLDMGEMTEGRVKTRTGIKRVFAIANGPSLAECRTEEEMEGTVIGLGEWNGSADGFIMSGSNICTVSGNSVTICPVDISRYVSRVVLKSITNKLPEAFGTLHVTGVMLTNAVASHNIGGDSDDMMWDNKLGHPDILSPHSSCTLCDSEIDLSSGESHETPIRLYCYPNPTASDRFSPDHSFSPRYTRLVIAASIDDKEYYYPIPLPGLERNTTYDVSVTVYHAGSDDPEEPASPAYVGVYITARDWYSGPDITENL